MTVDLGLVIAERHYELLDTEAGSQKVRVLLGAPRQAEQGDWYCPWQIVGVGTEKVSAAWGIDPFQCLQLVMKMIGATLAAGDRSKSLRWLHDESGDLGFPLE